MRSASMGSKSIPSSRRENFRTSTRFSRRSRRSCDRGWCASGAFRFHGRSQRKTSNTEHRTSNIQRNGMLGLRGCFWAIGCWALDVGCWMFGLRSARRVMGAWWPSRSSKPLSARSTGRGMFDSYPLRHFQVRSAESGTAGVFIPHSALRTRRLRISLRKEVVVVSRDRILRLTSLSSCAG